MASRRQIAIKSGQAEPKHLKSKLIVHMMDDKEMIVFLNATAKLSDKDFRTVLHQNGVRVAGWKQRQQALKGNKRAVDALEVYIKRAYSDLADNKSARVQDDATPLPAYKPRGEAP